MGALRLALAGLTLMLSGTGQADPPDRWSEPIAEASARFDIPEAWIRRVIEIESGGRTMLDGRPIRSPAGALGLMQIMPGTWRALREAHGLGPDPHHPYDNILAGAAYLRSMYDRFGYPGLFAAYNAGPARYAEHPATGRPLPAETVAYVAAVTEAVPAVAPSEGRSTRSASLFFTLETIAPDDYRDELELTRPQSAGALFVTLRRQRVAGR